VPCWLIHQCQEHGWTSQPWHPCKNHKYPPPGSLLSSIHDTANRQSAPGTRAVHHAANQVDATWPRFTLAPTMQLPRRAALISLGATPTYVDLAMAAQRHNANAGNLMRHTHEDCRATQVLCAAILRQPEFFRSLKIIATACQKTTCATQRKTS